VFYPKNPMTKIRPGSVISKSEAMGNLEAFIVTIPAKNIKMSSEIEMTEYFALLDPRSSAFIRG